MTSHLSIEDLIDARAGHADESHVSACDACATLSEKLDVERSLLRAALDEMPPRRRRWTHVLPFAAAAAVMATILGTVMQPPARKDASPFRDRPAHVARPPIQDPPPKTESVGAAFLNWIARHQGEDGSWGAGHRACDCFPPAKPPEAVERKPAVEKTAKPLIAELASEDADARERAHAALVRLGRDAGPFIDDALKTADDADLRARLFAARARVYALAVEPHVEHTSLALLAMLAAGYSHLSKDVHEDINFGTVVKSSLKWLLAHQAPDGNIGAAPKDGITSGNALAAQALAEAYGMTASQLLKEPAQKAIDWIASKQRASGAWGDGKDDLIPTVWAALTMKSAELSDLSLPGRALTGPAAWLENQAENGKELEAAAYAYVGSMLDRKRDVSASLKKLEGIKPAEADPLLVHLTSNALFRTLAPHGLQWKAWNEAMKSALVPSKGGRGCDRGSWGDGAARPRSTLLNALTLEVYYRYAK